MANEPAEERTSTRTLTMVVFAVLSPLFTHCVSGECDPGSHRCVGSTLQTCSPPCSDVGCTAHWESSQCDACVSPKNVEPFCALSSTIEPKCSKKEGFCDGDTVVVCQAGYRTTEMACGAGLTCVAIELKSPSPFAPNDGTTLCALSQQADMRCGSDQGVHGECSGQEALQCNSGYLISSSSCANACVTFPDSGLTRCVLSDVPDPRCANKDYYCDGDVRVECEGRYVLSRDDCASRGLRCIDDGQSLHFCE